MKLTMFVVQKVFPIAYILLSNVILPVHCNINKENAHFAFKHVGSTMASMSHANLKFEINLLAHLETLEALKKKMNQTTVDLQHEPEHQQLEEAMQRLGKRLDRSVHRVEHYLKLRNQVFNQDEKKTRQKRFIFTLAALAIAGALIAGTAYGLYTHHELSRLNENQDVIAMGSATIGQSVQENQKEIELLSAATDKLKKRMATIDRRLLLNQLILDYEDTILSTEVALDSFGSVMSSMLRQQPAPQILEGVDVNIIAKEVEDQASAKGYKVLLQHAIDILQCRCSFIESAQGYEIFVHIPLAKEESLLDVYQFIPLPIPVHANLHLSVQNDYSFISVNKEKDRFQAFSAAELAECNLIGKVYFCENNNVVSKKNFQMENKDDAMCLLAIHTQALSAVKQLCKWQVAIKESMALQLSPKKFVMFHHLPHQATITCANSTRSTPRTFTAFGVNTLEVEPNCVVETKSHVLYGSESVVDREWEVTWRWPHTLDSLIGNINFTEIDAMIKMDVPKFTNRTKIPLDEAIESLKTIHGAPPTSHATVAWLSLFSSTSIVAIFFCIIAGCTGFACWRDRRTKRKIEKRRQEMIELQKMEDEALRQQYRGPLRNIPHLQNGNRYC